MFPRKNNNSETHKHDFSQLAMHISTFDIAQKLQAWLDALVAYKQVSLPKNLNQTKAHVFTSKFLFFPGSTSPSEPG